MTILLRLPTPSGSKYMPTQCVDAEEDKAATFSTSVMSAAIHVPPNPRLAWPPACLHESIIVDYIYDTIASGDSDRLLTLLTTLTPSIRRRCVHSVRRSCTPLTCAIYRGDVRCVRALLTAGAADANQLSADLSRQRIETPLLAAARQDRADLAAALLEYGADVNTVDCYQHSPLWLAVRHRNTSLCTLLVEHGAHINMGNRWSQCPLFMAVKYDGGRDAIALLLLRHGARIDCTDVFGHSTLYWAVINGQHTFASLLIHAGAHVTQQIRRMILAQENVRERPTTHVAHTHNSAASQHLCTQLHTPPSLYLLCAVAVRRRVCTAQADGTSIWPCIDQLPLPNACQRRLKMLTE